jgi:hypothetical protein
MKGPRDHDATSSGAFSELEMAPELVDWEVVLVERATGGDLSAEMLDGASQLWLMGTDRDFDTILGTAEADAAEAFAAGGGGVFITSDHTDSNYTYSEDVNPLAERFGLTFSGSRNEASSVSERTPESPAEVLMAGVSTLPGFATVGVLNLEDAAVQVAFNFDDYPTVAYRDDGPRVVFDRTWLGWSYWQIDMYDQRLFIQNVAKFLEPCTER